MAADEGQQQHADVGGGEQASAASAAATADAATAAADAAAPRRRRVWLSWSSGKDAAMALIALRRDPGVEVVGLMTTLNEAAGRVAMHGVRAQLLREQAAAAGLPLHEIPLPFPCSNEAYEAAMTRALAAARAAGVEAVAFGDIHLADVRAYREERMRGTGLGVLFPLWGRDTKQLAAEVVAAGVEAILVCVDPKRLPEAFAGRRLDAALLKELRQMAGVDPCGENGEFHTLVVAGPAELFPGGARLAVRGNNGDDDGAAEPDARLRVRRGGFVYYDVVPSGVPLDEALADAARARDEAAAADAAAAAAAAAEADACPIDAAKRICPPPPTMASATAVTATATANTMQAASTE